jgi:hypothetical protein
MRLLGEGHRVALTRGGQQLAQLASAAHDLKEGRRTHHPELILFPTWGDLQDYAAHDPAGRDLQPLVGLVDTHGTDAILAAVAQLSPEQQAEVTVSTAHKAKGREWARVRIGKGFTPPPVDDEGAQRLMSPAEARLVYVAVSRARHLLDPEGIAWIDDYEESTADAGRQMIVLSLTAQLRYRISPVSRFMTEHLPDTVEVERDYLTHLRGLPAPVQLAGVRRPDWSALGHAIDYRIRLSLGGDLGPAVEHGVRALDGLHRFAGMPADDRTRRALFAVGRHLLAAVDAHLDDPGGMDEETVVRLCFVASFFEDIYRTGRIGRSSMLAEATPSTRLTGLLAAVPAHVIDDIGAQMRLAERPLAPFRALPPAARVCGPVFTGSGDLGGADADYILGGTLLDCKATRNPRRLGREEIYQLAGYLLLDYDDDFGIDRVGFYLSRQGGLITWSADEFVRRLGAKAPLPRLRDELRTHLHTANDHHRQSRDPRFDCR